MDWNQNCYYFHIIVHLNVIYNLQFRDIFYWGVWLCWQTDWRVIDNGVNKRQAEQVFHQRQRFNPSRQTRQSPSPQICQTFTYLLKAIFRSIYICSKAKLIENWKSHEQSYLNMCVGTFCVKEIHVSKLLLRTRSYGRTPFLQLGNPFPRDAVKYLNPPQLSC